MSEPNDNEVLEGVVLNMDETLNIPPHLSKKTFRRFEPLITRAVDRWPEETEFPREQHLSVEGNVISATTFASVMRNAIASALRYEWSPTTVNMEKLMLIRRQFCVAHDSSGVWFRAKGRHQRPAQYVNKDSVYGEAARSFSEDPLVTGWTEKDVENFCELLSKKLIPGPIFLAGEVAPDLITALNAQFQPVLVVEFDPNKNRTMLVS